MKKIFFIFIIMNSLFCFEDEPLLDGDIVFQESRSSQSKAVQIATKSKYSHMGILYKKNNRYFVFEAIQPVKLTPWEEWIESGVNRHYVVKRLKNRKSILTPSILRKMKSEGEKFTGKNYDLYFGWSDDKIYCSELVWKIYKRAANIEIGELKKLKDFDLANPIVKEKLRERYGNNIPLEETVIPPSSIYDSKYLYTVIAN